MLFTAKFRDGKLVLFKKEVALCSVVNSILPFSYQINIPHPYTPGPLTCSQCLAAVFKNT